MASSKLVPTGHTRGDSQSEPRPFKWPAGMLWRVSLPLRSRCKPEGFILPCQPERADRPPSGPDWLHEIKFDRQRIAQSFCSSRFGQREWSGECHGRAYRNPKPLCNGETFLRFLAVSLRRRMCVPNPVRRLSLGF